MTQLTQLLFIPLAHFRSFAYCSSRSLYSLYDILLKLVSLAWCSALPWRCPAGPPNGFGEGFLLNRLGLTKLLFSEKNFLVFDLRLSCSGDFLCLSGAVEASEELSELVLFISLTTFVNSSKMSIKSSLPSPVRRYSSEDLFFKAKNNFPT